MSVSLERRRLPSVFSKLIRRIGRDLQFSRIFTCDFVAAALYVIATIYLVGVVKLSGNALLDMALLATIFIALHIAKIVMVVFLERRGGDAREFMGSEKLVTEGVYEYSRNPVYLISILQSVIWSLLLLRGAMNAPIEPVALAAAILLPIGHFLSIDHLVIPNEEAALKQAHPVAFADYARRVNRWLGRRRSAYQSSP
jgi:protein-S-isoprenylcysteine O-methyltransferase Ste14